jgi:hypothetical protein
MTDEQIAAIREACAAFMDFLRSEDYTEDGLDDYESDIFEAALEAVYGPRVWDEISQIMGG